MTQVSNRKQGETGNDRNAGVSLVMWVYSTGLATVTDAQVKGIAGSIRSDRTLTR